jgi:hypothetical protein
VDPVPDPLLFRKSGSAGNRTQDLWVISQELRPLDHRGGRLEQYQTIYKRNQQSIIYSKWRPRVNAAQMGVVLVNLHKPLEEKY